MHNRQDRFEMGKHSEAYLQHLHIVLAISESHEVLWLHAQLLQQPADS